MKKFLKRTLFCVFVVVFVGFLFFPNAIYWLIIGKDFMSNILDDLYKKLLM